MERYTTLVRWYDALSAEQVYGAGRRRAVVGVDAVNLTYSPPLMSDVDGAWRSARALLRPGAVAAVVDMQPATGAATALAPAARPAC